MKLLLAVSVLFVIDLASAQNSTCSRNYWGTDCMNYCGECFVREDEDRVCDAVNGNCADGCLGGYTGTRCDQAKCKQDCGSGECLAPDFCGNCGDISKISPNCEDIRIRGLLGSLLAFLTIGTSLALCGFGSVWYKRRTNPSAL